MPYRANTPEVYHPEENLEAFYDESYLKKLYEEDRLAHLFLSLNDKESSSALHITPNAQEISGNHTSTPTETDEKRKKKNRKPKRFFQVFQSKKFTSKKRKSNVQYE